MVYTILGVAICWYAPPENVASSDVKLFYDSHADEARRGRGIAPLFIVLDVHHERRVVSAAQLKVVLERTFPTSVRFEHVRGPD